MQIEPIHVTIAGGSATITALLTFFLKDFFSTTKRDLRELTRVMFQLGADANSIAKDLRRIEGQLEVNQKELRTTTKECANIESNLKALWLVLKQIHPQHMPDRLSDYRDNGR